MSWNYDRSDERVKKHLDEMGEIEIKPMAREMNLDNLSETVCRDIFGAHVYAEIRNLAELVGELTEPADRQRLIQATHIYQREIARIASAVGAVRIHFQGGRVHLLVYRPINDASEIAAKATLAQLIIDRFGVIFSEEFGDLKDLAIRSGADMGQAIGTRNGTTGDRELLFLGAPANHAAKLMNPGAAARRLTETIFVELDDELGAWARPEDDGDNYRLMRPSAEALEGLLKDRDIEWSAEECRQRVIDDQAAYPADDAGLSGADARIDFDSLSYTNSKLVDGATIYADVSGFTAYIDAAMTDDEKRQALRALHAIRKEMARVIKDDFAGVRVQYQGDRAQGLFHIPRDDASAINNEAVSAAVGLQSSFELVLKSRLPQISHLGLAVGISRGDTIAAKLGERGHRDRICLGQEVLRAEANEELVDAGEIGISSNVREGLSPTLADFFKWRPASNCYVASGLTQDKVDLAEVGKAYDAGKPVYAAPTLSGVTITPQPQPHAQPIKPAASWSDEV